MRVYRNFIGSAAALVATAVVLAAPVAAQADEHKCTEARDKGNAAIASYYDPRIAQVDQTIAEIRAKHGDTDSLVNSGNEYLTLTELRSRLARDKGLAGTYAGGEIDKCEKQLKPLQDVVNGLEFIATGGLSGLLPGKWATSTYPTS